MVLYNITELASYSNPLAWLMLVNEWSNYVLWYVVIIAICLIMLIAGLLSKQSVDNVFMSVAWIGFLVSAFSWFVQFQGLVLLPNAFVPVLFAFLAGIASCVKIMRSAL